MREAERFGVTGWVRNRYDGTVEIEAQGDDAALESFIESMRQGPGYSVVRRLDATPLPESPEEKHFTVRF
jgi:acylphosphatase